MTYLEPEFTARDVTLLLAQGELDADMGSHGIPMSEAMDPDNQFAFEVPKVPRKDWAEKALLDAQDAYYKVNKDASPNGDLWSVRRKILPSK